MKDQDLQLEEEAKQEALDKANSLTQDSGQEEATDSTALNSDNQVSIDSEELQKLEIVIQNGSGVPGDANNLKKVLEQAGFDNITTNNAESQRTGKTQVLYQSGLNPLIIEFLAENVKSFVGDIVLLENKSIDSDILITTSKRWEIYVILNNNDYWQMIGKSTCLNIYMKGQSWKLPDKKVLPLLNY